MKRPRLRRWAKWACTLAAGVCVALAALSGFYQINRFGALAPGATRVDLFLGGGLVAVQWTTHDDRAFLPRNRGWNVSRSTSWEWGFLTPAGMHWGAAFLRFPTGVFAGASVLFPILLTTIPAALLWYTDRRRSGPHVCKKCNYDRRGLLADAKCPECGTVPRHAA